MFGKDRKPLATKAAGPAPVEQPRPKSATGVPALSGVRYARPKILLLDLAQEVGTELRDAGYCVETGSLGRPYSVGESAKLEQLRSNATIPQAISEMDVVVVDMATSSPLLPSQTAPNTAVDVPGIWVSCAAGAIDPRPHAMAALRSTFDRILAHGGVFVVFASAARSQEAVVGFERFGNFYTEREVKESTWSLLDVFRDFQIEFDNGQHVECDDQTFPILDLLRRYCSDATFQCTIAVPTWARVEWMPLARNKFGKVVACVAVPKGSNGIIFVLPQLARKGAFVAELLATPLPLWRPDLFPDVEGQKWVHRQEYELPEVVALARERAQIAAEAEAKAQALMSQITELQAANEFTYDLLRATGDPLVAAVKLALVDLGFRKVVDVDEICDNAGLARREDLQILDLSRPIVVDIKGKTGGPTDDDVGQVQKHASLRVKNWRRTDVVGLCLVNHQRHLPPADRDNSQPFRAEMISEAKSHDLVLMTTWDFWRLHRSARRHSWSLSEIAQIFSTPGRAEIVPAHYTYIGKIAHVWTGRFGVVLVSGDVRIGDTVAVEFEVDFEEAPVASIMVAEVRQPSATIGDGAGMLWPEAAPKPREGLRVFRVRRVAMSSI